MKYLPLIWSSLGRKKLRTVITLLSILIAFLLFSYLAAIDAAFSMGVDVAGDDRLIVQHKVSLANLMPESYGPRLSAMDGVLRATHATWFGGVYQDARNFFPQIVVVPEEFSAIYPEFVLSPEELEAWKRNRTGAVVGRKTAERFGWKVGDRVPIQGTIWRMTDSDTWEFEIEGIYEAARAGVDETMFMFHYKFFDEARPFAKGEVGWYYVQIEDPGRAAEISQRIDETYANSQYPTKTATEKAWNQGFAEQVGSIGDVLSIVLSLVFVTILLVAGNTMSQSVRERFGDLGVLKTLGFSDLGVLGVVLAESFLLCGIGGGLGLLLGWALITFGGDPSGGFLSVFFFPPEDIVKGVGLVVLLGLVTGLVPALQAMRLSIVDALRKAYA